MCFSLSFDKMRYLACNVNQELLIFIPSARNVRAFTRIERSPKMFENVIVLLSFAMVSNSTLFSLHAYTQNISNTPTINVCGSWQQSVWICQIPTLVKNITTKFTQGVRCNVPNIRWDLTDSNGMLSKTADICYQCTLYILRWLAMKFKMFIFCV